jgi:hypothetical protein
MSQSIAADTHEARAGAGWPRALGGHLLTPSPQQSPSGTCLWEVAVSPRKSRPEPRQELLGEPRDWLLPREASMPPTAASSCTGPLCLPSVPPAPSVCLSLCVSSHLKLFLVHFHITAEPSLPPRFGNLPAWSGRTWAEGQSGFTVHEGLGLSPSL